jgi:hypothetical protein
VLPGQFAERLVGALNDSLAADVDPTPRSHLPVHHQALAIEFGKMLPSGPSADEIRIGDQDARRVRESAKDSYRLSRLHQQGFVVVELLEGGNDLSVAIPIARRTARAAVHDQVLRSLSHVRIEIVHQRAQCGFRMPVSTGDQRTPRRTNRRSLWSTSGLVSL